MCEKALDAQSRGCTLQKKIHHHFSPLHMKKPSQRAGGYRIGFLQFSST